MKLFHENPIFWNSEIESDNFTVWTVRLSVSISLRNLYNSLKSIKEKTLGHQTEVLLQGFVNIHMSATIGKNPAILGT